MSTRASRSSSAGCLVTSSAAFCKGIFHPSGIATVLSLVWLYALSCVTSACELRLLLVGLLRDLPSRLICGMYDTHCSDRRSGLEMAGHLGESSLPPGFLSSWQFNVTFLWSNQCSHFGQLGGGLAPGLLVPFLRQCRSRFGSLIDIVCACFVLLQHLCVLQLRNLPASVLQVRLPLPLFHAFCSLPASVHSVIALFGLHAFRRSGLSLMRVSE